MVKELLVPDYIFEVSWEVCNKVGGIYTVLSTKAKTLQEKFYDKIFFIGPDLWKDKNNPLFIENTGLFREWKEYACKNDNLFVRIGRWNVPGNPIAILVDFQPFFEKKNEIYTQMWEKFKVDSLHAYGDYDESSMFAYAAGKVVESFYHYNLKKTDKVIYQAHEWMTGMGVLYLQEVVPEIATVFTTHATSIGRSIASNNKPLYDYLFAYDGDQMAIELNMQSKHSIEKQTAYYADCFTTVSEITNNECRELLGKEADVVMMNGFENDFIPQGITFDNKRKIARSLLLNLANNLMGTNLGDNTLILGTSGRYEFRNKGIDVFLESLSRLNRSQNLHKEVLAFISVPGWVKEPRNDLWIRMESRDKFDTPLDFPFITHWLHDMDHDQILSMLKYLNLQNRIEDKVKVVFIPCYLNGEDGILNKNYYDLLIGQDLSVYASYYEPWGYTPLESIAFRVPTITTDLSGFGRWVNGLKNQNGIVDGVEVLHRSDYNYSELADDIKDTILLFLNKMEQDVSNIRCKAESVAELALWKYFIQHYYEAYDVALHNAAERFQRRKN